MRKLLNIDANAKTVKGQKQGYMTAVLYLAPVDLSGWQVCPMASAGCAAACLNTAGRGAFSATQRARIEKTQFYFRDRVAFMAQLVKEIAAFQRKAARKGLIPCVRLNGTSDIPWERVPCERDGVWHENIMCAFPNLQFYDYTKRDNRRNLPVNYHLTFSLADGNEHNAAKAARNGLNVAAVYRTAVYPVRDHIGGVAMPTVDGTETDLRFLDPQGVIVALCAKGKAKYDTTGFVRDFSNA